MTGKRTYLMAIAIILHQILNAVGMIDITGEQLSMAIDVILGIGVFIFRKIAKPKV